MHDALTGLSAGKRWWPRTMGSVDNAQIYASTWLAPLVMINLRGLLSAPESHVHAHGAAFAHNEVLQHVALALDLS